MIRIGALMFLFGVCLLSQPHPGDDIESRLFANGEYPRVIQLSDRQEAEAVNKLRMIERSATGKRLQKVSFLLAALDDDYSRHRDFLVAILRGCAERKADCDEDTVNLLVGLYRSGRRDVLNPLLVAGTDSDGAVAELLARFYADLMVSARSDFLVGLSRLSPSARRAVCSLPVSEDFQPLRRALSQVGSNVALACLRDLGAASDEAAKDEPAEQPKVRN